MTKFIALVLKVHQILPYMLFVVIVRNVYSFDEFMFMPFPVHLTKEQAN